MKKVFPILLFLFSATAIFFACDKQVENTQEVEIEKTVDSTMEPGMMHVVHFWLTEGLSEAETADFVRGAKSLEGVPTVMRHFIGPPASTPSRGVVDNSFDYALILWFEDVEAHNAYQVDPIHLKFVENHEAKFGKVVVQDNFLE